MKLAQPSLNISNQKRDVTPNIHGIPPVSNSDQVLLMKIQKKYALTLSAKLNKYYDSSSYCTISCLATQDNRIKYFLDVKKKVKLKM